MTSIAQDTRDKVVSLEAEMRAKLDAILREMQDAKQGRARLYDRIDKIEAKQDAIEVVVKNTEKRLSDAEPTIANLNKWKERGRGAWYVIVSLWVALGAVITMLAKKFWVLVSG